MNPTEILEKAKEYCEYEYQDCKNLLKENIHGLLHKGL